MGNLKTFVIAITLLIMGVVSAACGTPSQPILEAPSASAPTAYAEDPMPTADPVPDPEAASTSAPGSHEDAIGSITALDASSITVDGILYGLTASTEVKGSLEVGTRVKVEFITNADGSRTALEVKTGEFFDD